MLHIIYRLTCNYCNRVEYNDGSECEDELRRNAKSFGWHRIVVGNGSLWDFCPSCAKKHINESENISKNN